MTTPAEVNLLSVVRTLVRTNPNPSGLALEIKEALEALDAERAAESRTRKFLVNYSWQSPDGAGTGSVFATMNSRRGLTEDRINAWQDSIVRANLHGRGRAQVTNVTELDG